MFYVTTTGNFERFQYLKVETNFLNNEKRFLKNLEYRLLVESTKIDISTKLLCQKQIEWGVQTRPITKNGVLPETASFFNLVPRAILSLHIKVG